MKILDELYFAYLLVNGYDKYIYIDSKLVCMHLIWLFFYHKLVFQVGFPNKLERNINTKLLQKR